MADLRLNGGFQLAEGFVISRNKKKRIVAEAVIAFALERDHAGAGAADHVDHAFAPTPERPHLQMRDGRRSGRDSAGRNPAMNGTAGFNPRGSTVDKGREAAVAGLPAGQAGLTFFQWHPAQLA